MKSKVTISKQIDTCYEYVDNAERAALNGSLQDSNNYWTKASNIAANLLEVHSAGTFTDEEYDFLTQIAKHFKD